MERDKLKKEVSKRPISIFFIDAKKAYYFNQNLNAPLALDFPPDVISDLEIINKKKLEALLQGFINGYNIYPSNIIIVLSTLVTFEKEFSVSSIEMDKNIEEFLELVPFEDHISKKVLLSGKTKVVAGNRDLCDFFKRSFQNLGFVVNGIYPLSLCVEIMPQLQSNLDLGLILTKTSEIRDFNLVPDVEAQSVSSNTPEKEKKNNTRTFMLLGVFAFLLVILLFVLYRKL
jgi:hypothetical protein